MPNKIVKYNFGRDHTSLFHSTNMGEVFLWKHVPKGVEAKIYDDGVGENNYSGRVLERGTYEVSLCQELQSPSINYLYLSKISTFVVFKKCVSCPCFFSQPMSEKLGTPTLARSKTVLLSKHSILSKEMGTKKFPFHLGYRRCFVKILNAMSHSPPSLDKALKIWE